MNLEEPEKIKEMYQMRSDVSDNEDSAKQIVEPTTIADQAEAVLYDVLDQVFSYLNVRDLSNAARVSKSWRDTARRELSNRGPENVILPYYYDCEDNFDYSSMDDDEIRKIQFHESSTHVSNFIRTNPKACIFFTDDIMYRHDPGTEICRRFWNQLSHESSIVVFSTVGINIDETEVSTTNNLAASLLLPSTRMVDVKVFREGWSEPNENFKNENYTRQVVDKLFSPEQEHTCIIMFNNDLGDDLQDEWTVLGLKFQSDVFSNLKKRCKISKYNLWGGTIPWSMVALGAATTDIWIGVSISGPSLRSWTIVLDCKLSNSVVEQKLLTFKKDVDLKSDSVALMLVPSNEEITSAERLSRITAFKKIFPTLHLLSVFSNQQFPVFSVNSNGTETDQEICHMNSIAYLILSYGKS